jgi:hypothetical protein
VKLKTLKQRKGELAIMPNIYAPIPDYDQTVEFVTQADPDEEGFYDVVINPISLDDQDLANPQTVEILATGYENVASLGRDVSQDDIDTLQAAAEDSGADDIQIAAISNTLNRIKINPSPIVINPKPIIGRV